MVSSNIVYKLQNSYAQSSRFKNDFNNFNQEWTNWQTAMGLEALQLAEAQRLVRTHPWEQFSYDQPEGQEATKNPKLRHKTKLRRHIQRINPAKLKDDQQIENAPDSTTTKKTIA